jgi:hypothetical protein
MNILDAINDPAVFGEHFRGRTWAAWLAFLCALFALPMSEEQLELYRKHTGRSTPPSEPLHEAWLVCGRRAGKSFVLATIAVFLACFRDWRPLLGPGELGTVMVVAEDRKQARAIMRFIGGLLRGAPMLRRTMVGETAESFTLKNRVQIEVHAASFRSTRGYTIIAALLDEVAIWPTDEESSEPDVEVINAVRPGMATIPDAMLLCASSPHARKGALWDAHRKHYGKDGDPVLVWQAATRDMNATVPQSYIDSHMAEDAARAGAEYMAQFRSDVEGYVVREAVMACVTPGVYERPPDRRIAYCGFADMSGGSRDSAALCIAHNQFGKQVITIDCLREIKSPHSPEQACEEFAKVLKSYGLARVVTDRYAGAWPVEQFGRFNIYCEAAADPKGALYLNMLPFINSGRVELLDEARSLAQLLALERRTGHGRGDVIDHPPGHFDDAINSIAGAISLCSKFGGYNVRALADVDPDDADDPNAARAERAERYKAALLQRYGQPCGQHQLPREWIEADKQANGGGA